ncbi:cytochrome-c peroxidase [Methylococcus capsulatus]|uniref:cytochrome-c peroxidase n=1 Tax=Methylococcus capsulatus TaxID=414 RepID=UPI001C52FBF1|nr:cytochrome c peroxidase [Methylococcus capsulatus]QXP87457.1 c-type cytochrome [Methylococcus capsulatus]QXP92805.1 c-type cytochrome [Methylococcus capsulatus]UQN12466.1 c-type cytochrome [Methylococcus capsulatus]
MKYRFTFAASILGLMASLSASPEELTLPGGKHLSKKARLGQKLFFDTNLSTPPGQACSSCHDPATAFSDPNKSQPTSNGALKTLKGNRNAPTAAYAAYTPPFHYDPILRLFVGGQFLDGRAPTLKEQAKGPFLNPLEMANPDKQTVVNKVREAEYAWMFDEVFGPGSLDNTRKAYDRIAAAIAAFERSPVFARFDSKYDYYLKGKVKLTPQEMRGLVIFESEEKGNCAACHPSRPSANGTPPLFTDHTYDNLGVPKNPNNPFYALPPTLNPDGPAFVDLGLGKRVGKFWEDGKLKVPTLRNIALTAPYMHNGYFSTLRSVVDFYNTRDVRPTCWNELVPEADAQRLGCWPAPEVKQNVNGDELGNLRLSDREVDDLVAFLKTLTDGYRPE